MGSWLARRVLPFAAFVFLLCILQNMLLQYVMEEESNNVTKK